MQDISTDKRVQLLQLLAQVPDGALVPESNLASPLGYCYTMARNIFESRPGDEVKRPGAPGEIWLPRQTFFRENSFVRVRTAAIRDQLSRGLHCVPQFQYQYHRHDSPLLMWIYGCRVGVSG
jgi:hypothetical protein